VRSTRRVFELLLGLSGGTVEVVSDDHPAYRQAARFNEAVEAFKKAIEIDPSNGAYYYTLAVTYHQLGEYDRAIEYCDKAAKRGFAPHPAFLDALKQYRK